VAEGHGGAVAARRDRHRRRGQTNLPGVFAAGDCTTVPYKQIIIAMGAGATAALSAFDHLIRSSVSNSSGAVAEAA
jgi:alkyl hydroperoxide reductase subunit F